MITLALGVFLFGLILPSLCVGQAKIKKDKESILNLCERYFGKVVDKKLLLYEANSLYVLHVVFNKKGNLKRLAIVPKYFFYGAHPEWEESDTFQYLTWTEHKNFLARLDMIKPKGKLVKSPPKISFVTNRTVQITTVYENAILTHGRLVTLDQDENLPVEIRWFRVEFGTQAKKKNTELKLNKKAWDGFFKKRLTLKINPRNHAANNVPSSIF
jgi:hypothetical protein